jgi:raffinose/stachyose/melibiose transport system permease protein
LDLIVSTKTEKWIVRVSLYLLALVFLFPIVTALRNSLLVNGFQNYIFLFTHKIGGLSILKTFVNSGLIALGDVTFILIIGTLAAFAFAKLHFLWKEQIYAFVLICLAVPGVVLLVPYFYLLKNLGLYNSLWAVIIAQVTLTLPFAVLMLRNFFDNLPGELMESAVIDGATKFQVFRTIYLPLSLPALINLGVLSIMWSFQDFLLPVMFITSKELTTATVAVSSFKGLFGFTPADMGKFNAALVILGLPSLIIFVLAQKYITQGVTSGAIKE